MRKKQPPDPIDISIGDRLRQRRRRMSLSQQELSDRSGVTVRTLNRYENGNRGIAASDLYRLCQALEISVPSLFVGFEDGLAASPGRQIPPADDIETRRFLKSFYGITDLGLRKDVVALIKAVAEDQQNNP
ncbi:MAG: helix-turn-helix transcriptional regulator [Rhodospirillales bacterium]|nr:helix-turn-helix transcriptional regulator [Rhodospirillales bacterium]